MSTEVSESTGYGPDREMSVIGYVIAGILALALLPLLPFLAVGWVVWRLLRSDDDSTLEPRGWGGPRRERRA